MTKEEMLNMPVGTIIICAKPEMRNSNDTAPWCPIGTRFKKRSTMQSFEVLDTFKMYDKEDIKVGGIFSFGLLKGELDCYEILDGNDLGVKVIGLLNRIKYL
ncbi:MAG TPA: hypothetical protein VKR58_11245 [Aquella sp.]|nr:hypothetical protein [Aquella sp.]